MAYSLRSENVSSPPPGSEEDVRFYQTRLAGIAADYNEICARNRARLEAYCRERGLTPPPRSTDSFGPDGCGSPWGWDTNR